MKKIVSLLLIIALCLCGCTNTKYAEKTENANTEKVVGVWISVYEIEDMIKNGFVSEFEKLTENLKRLNVNRVYMHFYAFGESLYPSEVFAESQITKNLNFNLAEYAVNRLKSENISVYAWLNPYRVNTSGNLTEAQKSLINPLSDISVCYYGGGTYLNPASNETRKLLLNGIREIITNYNVDGIHFDDYFYPTTDADFDKASFGKYVSETENPQTLDNYRRANVTALISAVSAYLKTENKCLSISPSASVEHNYNNLYADIISFCKLSLIDEVVPQLYFGFCYPKEEYTFEALFETWSASLTNCDVKFLVGLNSYKIGTTSGADAPEWENGTDVLANEVRYAENRNADGYVIFSVSTLFSDNELNRLQRENIINYQGE